MKRSTRLRWTWIAVLTGVVAAISVGLLVFVVWYRPTPVRTPAAEAPGDRGTATLPVDLNDATRSYLKELNRDDLNAWEQAGAAASSRQQYLLGCAMLWASTARGVPTRPCGCWSPRPV